MEANDRVPNGPSPNQSDKLLPEREERLRRTVSRIARQERRNYFLSVLVLAISLAAGAGWLYYSIQKVRDLNRQSSDLNQKIAAANEQLGILRHQTEEAKEKFKQVNASKSLAEAKSSAEEGREILKVWVVIGGYPDLDHARDQEKRAGAQGFDSVLIAFRQGMFRTVLVFASAADAANKFSEIRNLLEPGAYLRDPKTWCTGATQADGYLKCQE